MHLGICVTLAEDGLDPRCAACKECHEPLPLDPSRTYACPSTTANPTMNTSTANPTMNTSPQPTTITGIFRAGNDLTLTSEGSIIANGLDLVSQPARPAPQSRPHHASVRILNRTGQGHV